MQKEVQKRRTVTIKRVTVRLIKPLVKNRNDMGEISPSFPPCAEKKALPVYHRRGITSSRIIKKCEILPINTNKWKTEWM